MDVVADVKPIIGVFELKENPYNNANLTDFAAIPFNVMMLERR